MSRRFALIIGSSEFEDASLAQLKAPDADVAALGDMLRSAEIGGFDEVKTLVNEPFAAIYPEIAHFFTGKKRDDLLLLYFSGHGVLDDQGRLFLALKNTRRELLRGTAVPATFISDEMDGSNSRRQVLVLDCCHSGAFARGTKGVVGASVGTAATFEGTGYGRVVLTATDATQYAWEGDQVIGQAQKSVFTRYLIQGLQTGEADADRDGKVTLDELYDYVYAHVVNETPRQTPGKWTFKEQGEIIIARNPITKAAELPAELQQSIEDPRPWVREGAVRELDQLLRSSHAGLALAAYEALTQLAEDDSRRVLAAAKASLSAHAKAEVPRPASVDTATAHGATARSVATGTARDEPERTVRTVAELSAGERSDAQVAQPAILAGRRPIWTYGRLAIVLLLMLGFFGPWFQITACAAQGQPPPPPTVYAGREAYLVALESILFAPIPIAVGALFLLTLIRLIPGRLRENITVIRLERVVSGLALIGIGVASGYARAFLIFLGQWGFWLTFVGVVLAPINLLMEVRLTGPPGRRLPRWAWILGSLTALVLFALLILVVAVLLEAR